MELFARFTGGALNLGEVSLPVVALFFALLFGWTTVRQPSTTYLT
jgi:hypothetical protein